MFKDKKMESFDTKTLIHAGVEFLAITSITIWFSRKNKKLQEQIDTLNEHVSKLEEIISSQNQIINQHHQLLMGGMSMSQQPQQMYSQQVPSQQTNISNKTKPRNEELDEELERELERSSDEECEGDVCYVKPKKKQKGKKKVRFEKTTT